MLNDHHIGYEDVTMELDYYCLRRCLSMTANKSLSQTLQRGLMILDLYTKSESEYSVKEISDILKFSPTIGFRLVNTLVGMGYLTRNVSNGKYRLGMSSYRLGIFANPNPKLVEKSHPFLEKISSETNETVSINVFDPVKMEGVCIASVESKDNIKFSSPVGLSRPLYKGASRKTILAYLTPSQQELVIDEAEKQGFQQVEKLKKELQLIKKNGYCYSEGEVTAGALNVSSPILTKEGLILASIAIHCPAYRKKKIR